MKTLPRLRRLTSTPDYQAFAQKYEQCSKLPVPQDYLEANHVFGIYLKNYLIGGFILGCGAPLRTVRFFAQADKQDQIYQQLGAPNTFTEICCFWIDSGYRKKTTINYFIWISMAYALKRYGTANIIFGTNSSRLAALYSTTKRSIFLHQDRINRKSTYIFTAARRGCVKGILEIVYFKFKRKLQLEKTRQMSYDTRS